jgi:hypothetical protein
MLSLTRKTDAALDTSSRLAISTLTDPPRAENTPPDDIATSWPDSTDSDPLDTDTSPPLNTSTAPDTIDTRSDEIAIELVASTLSISPCTRTASA